MFQEKLPELALGILGECLEQKRVSGTLLERQQREIVHAQDVLDWIHALYPNPSPELEAAGLLHDSERIINVEVGIGFKGNRDSAEYYANKKAHAARSAELAQKNLTALGVPPESVARTVFLITHHDDRGTEVEEIKDQELNILVAADSFSFFTSIALDMFAREGSARVIAKVRFMVDKMPASLRLLLLQQQIPDPEINAIKNDILKEFGINS